MAATQKNAAIPVLRFDPRADGLRRWLGPLETEIMAIAWGGVIDRLTVKRVWNRIKLDRAIAYTTVMTTMTRLNEKGLFDRTREGMAYVYHPTCTEDEFEEAQITAIVENLDLREVAR